MPNITQWAEGELETFSHKLQEIITGPGRSEVPGFIFISFPFEESAKARMLANVDGRVCVTVLYKILQALVDKESKH